MTGRMDAIRTLLRVEWNPTGADRDADAPDRYDGYALRLFSMLYSAPTEQRIADYLERVQTIDLGLAARPAHNRAVARKLLAMLDEEPPLEMDAPEA